MAPPPIEDKMISSKLVVTLDDSDIGHTGYAIPGAYQI
jgi:hypothetical protein